MTSEVWRWGLGLSYIVSVAIIWIAASFVVQSVVDAGVSPFLITYICNSLFVVYIPLVEIGRYLEDTYGSLVFWRKGSTLSELRESEEAVLLSRSDSNYQVESSNQDEVQEKLESFNREGLVVRTLESDQPDTFQNVNEGLDEKRRWTRIRVAKVSLLICPFWFLAQLSFNLSLKYTTVTVSILIFSCCNIFCV